MSFYLFFSRMKMKRMKKTLNPAMMMMMTTMTRLLRPMTTRMMMMMMTTRVQKMEVS